MKRLRFFYLLICLPFVLAFSGRSIFIDEKTDPAEGWWIFVNYHDNIFTNKKIAPYHTPPTAEAVLLYVGQDSIFSFGTISPGIKYIREKTSDTLSGPGRRMGVFTIVFDKNKNCPVVNWEDWGTNKKRKGTYRRLTKYEMRITMDLLSSKDGWQFQKNYHDYLVKNLIAGKYRSVEEPSKIMHLRGNETMSGYGKWNKYALDDYFGTLHWTPGQDRIRFEDSTSKMNDYKLYNSDRGPYRDYSWRFSGDTLFLQEFTGYDIELYKPGTKTVRFIRIRD